MCMVVYLASSSPLPLLPWDENAPSFHVKELREDENSVRKQFTKPFVFYLGAHTGCGCGFDYGQFVDNDRDEAKERETVTKLAKYLRSALEIARPLEIFSCWYDEIEQEPDLRETLSVQEVGGERFCFNELELLTIVE